MVRVVPLQAVPEDPCRVAGEAAHLLEKVLLRRVIAPKIPFPVGDGDGLLRPLLKALLGNVAQKAQCLSRAGSAELLCRLHQAGFSHIRPQLSSRLAKAKQRKICKGVRPLDEGRKKRLIRCQLLCRLMIRPQLPQGLIGRACHGACGIQRRAQGIAKLPAGNAARHQPQHSRHDGSEKLLLCLGKVLHIGADGIIRPFPRLLQPFRRIFRIKEMVSRGIQRLLIPLRIVLDHAVHMLGIFQVCRRGVPHDGTPGVGLILSQLADVILRLDIAAIGVLMVPLAVFVDQVHRGQPLPQLRLLPGLLDLLCPCRVFRAQLPGMLLLLNVPQLAFIPLPPGAALCGGVSGARVCYSTGSSRKGGLRRGLFRCCRRSRTLAQLTEPPLRLRIDPNQPPFFARACVQVAEPPLRLLFELHQSSHA